MHRSRADQPDVVRRSHKKMRWLSLLFVAFVGGAFTLVDGILINTTLRKTKKVINSIY